MAMRDQKNTSRQTAKSQRFSEILFSLWLYAGGVFPKGRAIIYPPGLTWVSQFSFCIYLTYADKDGNLHFQLGISGFHYGVF